MEKRLWRILAGTDGGSNREQIIRALDRSSANANQLADRIDINYNTARYHLDVLRDHGIVDSTEDADGEVFSLTEEFLGHWAEFERIASQLR